MRKVALVGVPALLLLDLSRAEGHGSNNTQGMALHCFMVLFITRRLVWLEVD